MAQPAIARLANFATPMSKTLAEASRNVWQLYRTAIKAAPDIVENYQLERTPSQVRQRIKEEFRKHKDVKDPHVIDMLVWKGKMELEEALQLWKTKSHVVRFFMPQKPQYDEFMKKFFEGDASEV